MNAVIVVMSQTGNTRKVGEAIAEGIKSLGHTCDVFSLKEAPLWELANYDIIGVGAPSYGYLEPYPMEMYLRKLKKLGDQLSGKPALVFATSGGHPGNVLPSMAEKLEERGMKIVGGWDCDGILITPPFYPAPWVTDGHPDEVDQENAYQFGKRMVNVSDRVLTKKDIPVVKWPRLLETAFKVVPTRIPKYQTSLTRGPKDVAGVPMTLDMSKCKFPECRVCMDLCPMNAIDLARKPIRFMKGCISCYSCQAACPHGAIEFDQAAATRSGLGAMANLRDYGYLPFHEAAKTQLIENRHSYFRNTVGEVNITDPAYMQFAWRTWHPRLKVVNGVPRGLTPGPQRPLEVIAR